VTVRLGRIDFVRLVEQAQHLADFEEALADLVRALPADPASIIEFLEIPTADAFNVPPAQAINYFKAKGLKPSFSYADMMDEAHDHAFTVAKMMDVDLLGQVRASLDAAMANGTSFKVWADQITPILQSGGWWGRKEVLDPLTGQTIVAQLGSPWRLETIFRTNMQTAYAAGAWQEIVANADTAPLLMYDAVDDDRTRPLHASWDQRVAPVTSNWWLTHYPPNGYNCRCGVIQLSREEAEALGLQVSIDPPSDGNVEWTNPRTGETLMIPKGIDPGFAHNAGESWAWKQKQILKEKVEQLPPDMRAAAAKAKKRKDAELADSANAAAKAAQAEAAAAQAKAALARAQAVAAEKSTQLAAQQQIDAIAKGSKDALGVGAQYKVKALAELKKSGEWLEAKPTDKLASINTKAAELKAKAVQSQGLSTYKKAIIEGKNPPPAGVKAFLSLPEAEADAFLAKIEAEKAKIEAAKAAQAKAAAEAAAKAASGVPPTKPKIKGGATWADDAEKALLAGDLDELQTLKSLVDEYAADTADGLALKAYVNDALAYLKNGPKPGPQSSLSASALTPDPAPPDPSTMVVVGRKGKGATEGAIYQDTSTGTKWMVKFNGSEDGVLNEVLAGRLYNLAGVEAPELHAITINGRPALASRIVDGITEVDAKTLAATQSVLDGFAVDAWLANWDVVGMNFDNTVLVGGRALRIDVGGSLRYRAMGGLKGQAFGRSVSEIDSLRDGTNSQARAVFGNISQADMERGVEKVLAVREADIRAMVDKFGPRDADDRSALADLLLARQRDLAKRYPAAAERVKARQQGAQAAPPASARVTPGEQEFVEQSRVNGYGFATDSDQIEDNMVLVHTLKRADGSDTTRGFFKLRPQASAALRESLALTAGEVPTIALGETRQAILEAVKSINFRASKGDPLDAKVVARIKSAIFTTDSSIAQLQKAVATSLNGDAIAEQIAALQRWRDELARVLPDAQAGRKAIALPQFDSAKIPDAFELKIKPKVGGDDAGAIRWKKVTGAYEFETAIFERSFAKLDGGRASVSGTSVRYEAELPDGTRVTYFPHDSGVAWAMQGVVKIDVPGRGVDATSRVFGSMTDMGLQSVRATALDRQHLYLNAYARIALLRDLQKLRQFEAIADRTEESLQLKLNMLRSATGVDIDASNGWRNVDGVRQAFGHGRAYQLRPDLSAQDMEQLGRTHVVYHNPQGLGWDAGSGVFERLKTIVDGGGMFASLTDRVRRGLPLSGSSVSSDLASGGGDYHFTRLGTKQVAEGTGLYWRPSVLRRMDAITYEGDMFGRTTGNTVETARRGYDVNSLKATAYGSGGASSNETIFKGGLSIFDDLDRIVLSSEAEVKDAINWMQSRGYKSWPDGRRLDEVIITKAKHRARR